MVRNFLYMYYWLGNKICKNHYGTASQDLRSPHLNLSNFYYNILRGNVRNIDLVIISNHHLRVKRQKGDGDVSLGVLSNCGIVNSLAECRRLIIDVHNVDGDRGCG